MPPREVPSNRRAQSVDVCQIHRWRGYVASTFYAATESGEVVAESQKFRWRGADAPPDAGRARLAYDELVRSLVADGWQRFDFPSRDWFTTYFARPRVAPSGSAAVGPITGPIEVVAPPQELHAVEPVAQLPPREPEPITFAPTAYVSTPPWLGEEEATEDESEEPDGPPADDPPRRLRKRWLMGFVCLVVVLAATATAVVELGWIHARTDATSPTVAAPAVAVQRASATVSRSGSGGQGSGPAASSKKSHPTKPATKERAATTLKPSVAAPAARRLADIRIGAHGSGSWVEIRRGSKTGKVLYSGQLNAGHELHFRARRLWARFGGASNLSIRVNNKPVALSGTVEKLFAPAR